MDEFALVACHRACKMRPGLELVAAVIATPDVPDAALVDPFGPICCNYVGAALGACSA